MTTDDTDALAGAAAPETSILDDFDFDEVSSTPAGAPAEPTQDPEPEADPSEPAEKAEPDAEDDSEQYVKGDLKTRLRDGREVTIAELKKLAGEAEEYRAKQADFDAQQREVQARQAQIAQQAQMFNQLAPQAIQVMQAQLGAPPDPSLIDSDPIAYVQQKASYDLKLSELQRMQAAQSFQHQQARAAEQAKMGEFLQTQQQELMTKLPELRDPAKAKEFATKFMDTVRKYGFRDNEVETVHDHRVLLMASDAMKWQALQAEKAKAVEKARAAPPVTPPVANATRRVSTAERERATVREQLGRLRKTGTASDGEAFLSQFD